MNGDVRIAVAGLGFGANHARILRGMPGVRLAAVADPDPERRAISAAAGVACYAGHADMLAAERLDAVVVAVPAALHEEIAAAAIAVGCSVLVEKPLAPSLAEARRIADAADRGGVLLMPGHIERFNPAVVELARRFHAGEIGRILQVSARRMSATRAGEHGSRLPPSDVNVVHDSAIHDIDVICALVKLEVETVVAIARTGIVTAAEDAVFGLMRFRANGTEAPSAALDVNWLSPRRVRDLTVTGESGTFVADYDAPSLTLYKRDARPQEIPLVAHDQLEAELTAFVNAVRTGAPPPVSPQDGLVAVAIADAITRSARRGKPVTLESLP